MTESADEDEEEDFDVDMPHLNLKYKHINRQWSPWRIKIFL